MNGNRLVCGQCVNGPIKGMKKKKCVWSGGIRSRGAMACKAKFASSADSGLRCTKCRGPMGYFEALNGDDLCAGCVKQEMSRLERRELFFCMAAGIVIAVAGVI
jgi:hypothetical protein